MSAQMARSHDVIPAVRRRLARLMATKRQLAVYIALLGAVAWFSVRLQGHGFVSTQNLVTILEQTAPISVMAVGAVLVLSCGEIDLSIGAVVALAALVSAIVLGDSGNAALAAGAGLGAGLGVGLVNGLLVTRLRLPSFLVTLGMMGLITGVDQRVTDLNSVPTVDLAFNNVFGSGTLFGISTLIVWTVGVVAAGHLVLRHTRFGAHLLATGDNLRSARTAGIRVASVKTMALAASGMLAALAGLLDTGNLHGADYTLGSTDLLTVITAVVIGGTRLFGGVGSVFGALAGSLLIGVVNNGLILEGFSTSEQQIAQGAIILLAVAVTLRQPSS
jgi:ribose transport system permease protein